MTFPFPLFSALAKIIEILISSWMVWAGSMGVHARTWGNKAEKYGYPSLHGRHRHMMGIHVNPGWVLQSYIGSGGSLDMNSERNNSNGPGTSNIMFLCGCECLAVFL